MQLKVKLAPKLHNEIIIQMETWEATPDLESRYRAWDRALQGKMLHIDDGNVDVIKWGLKEIASPFGLELTPPAARRSAQRILDKIQAARVASRYTGR